MSWYTSHKNQGGIWLGYFLRKYEHVSKIAFVASLVLPEFINIYGLKKLNVIALAAPFDIDIYSHT